MILHIVGSHMATRGSLSLFEDTFPNKNVILYLLDDGKANVINNGITKSFSSIKDAVKETDLTSVKVVVIQLLLHKKKMVLLKYIPSHIPVIWHMFGGDLYNHFLFIKGYELYAPQTIRYLKKEVGFPLNVKKFLFNKIWVKIVDHIVIKRIVGVIPCLEPDFYLACDYLKKEFDYVNIHRIQKKLSLPFTTGNDILIGHSASMTNNHLYVLDILKNVALGDSKLYLPLSYNIQNAEYKSDVKLKYKVTFGENVNFMEELQEREAYVNGFMNYKAAFFPCWRQEALGNIYICFQLGVKVFLSTHNPCYNYFKKVGFYVYDIESIIDEKDLAPLSQEEKERNRDLFVEMRNNKDLIVNRVIKSYFSKFV